MNSPRLSARFLRDKDGKIVWKDEFDPAKATRAKHWMVKGAESTSKFSIDEDQNVPIASFYFVMVGIGYLFPFSALTQPVDYWNLLFPDFNIEFLISVVYMYSNLIMLALLVFSGEDADPAFTPRIVGGFVGQLLVLVFVPTSYFLMLNEDWNKILILASTATAAIVTAFIDSSVIALAAQYPLRVQEFFQLGVGVSTLIGSVYRDLTKVAFPPSMIVESSLLYFYSGALTIAACIWSYCKLMQLPLSKVCLAKAQEEAKHAHDPQASSTCAIHNERTSLLRPGSNDESDANPSASPKKWVVFRKVLFNQCMVMLLFMSTLALWPPLVTEIDSFNFPALQASGWWSLVLLTVFSLLDCIGRLLVRFRCGLTKDNIWMAVLARFSLFPLIVCSVQGILFTNDAWSVLFVGLLGFTNGYVGTLSIVMVNECVSEEEQAIAGTFTGFFLNSGLVFGATIGLYVDKVVNGV